MNDGTWEVARPYSLRFEGRTAIATGLAGTVGATVPVPGRVLPLEPARGTR